MHPYLRESVNVEHVKTPLNQQVGKNFSALRDVLIWKDAMLGKIETKIDTQKVKELGKELNTKESLHIVKI